MHWENSQKIVLFVGDHFDLEDLHWGQENQITLQEQHCSALQRIRIIHQKKD